MLAKKRREVLGSVKIMIERGADYILAVADYAKVIVESNESNSAKGLPITVVP